ncbi:MAG TPA: phosphopentomutase [Gemmatimonadaceae bacterium]|nr:phosphopentomutase [Gemmatimonadaceae bacterium]
MSAPGSPLSGRRAAVIVLDGVGAGEARDAAAYGDVGSDTLGHVADAVGGLRLPALESLGLGRVRALRGLSADAPATGAWGLMRPASAGKDSTTGHWEIAGVHLERPFPTYPDGFPAEVVETFARRTGRPVIGNVVSSGTRVLEVFGPEHERTGAWILYTSADSVFQVAAHEAVVPLEELYAACEEARRLLVAPHDVSRVIARPFRGHEGAYERTANRRDFSIEPPAPTLLDVLADAGIPRAGVGKVDDLFARRALTARHTGSNAEGIRRVQEWMAGPSGGLLLANLVDFDQLYGHRNDAAGFYRALQEFDAALPALLAQMREDDLLFITADHGNDPTTPSTDHARENVPLLVAGARVEPRSLGVRETFSDLGATVAEWLGVGFRGRGTSFLSRIVTVAR